MTDTETNVDQEENEKEAKAWPQILAVFIGKSLKYYLLNIN